jgi:methionyl-tRNA synthetase
MGKNFYITTTAPYVNAQPHIGFAWEIVTADVIARYRRMQGDKVIFGYGTDEHGQKIYEKAIEEKQTPQAYVNKLALQYQELTTLLNLSTTHFQRTTNDEHMMAAQEFWNRCESSGDIYKKKYEVKYCVGCELEKTDSELNDGRCPLHPKMKLEIIEEDNYFFRFSKYQDKLLNLYESNQNFILPESKFNEMKSFVAKGLQDFSISRVKEKMPWGVGVPKDPDQVMYVWFDALVFYISTLGWPKKSEEYDVFWPGIQIAGKDNLRQQAAMWQAMLMSAGLINSKQILINGFISVEGQKMSKSLGNVISPSDLIDKYGLDAARYLLINLGPISSDADVSMSQFDETYDSRLANSLGNTVQRVATLCDRSGATFAQDNPPGYRSEVRLLMEGYKLDKALEQIWDRVSYVEKKIDKTQPWTLEGKKLQVVLMELVAHLRQVGYELAPFMPDTSQKVLDIFKGPNITKPSPLFPRLV